MKREWMEKCRQLPGKLKKYRYPALILLLGVGLMLFPFGKSEKSTSATAGQTPTASAPAQTDYQSQTEQRLRTLLSKIQGAGNVDVMLTLRTGMETVYQTDSTLSTQTDGGASQNSSSETTVLLSRDSVGQEAAVRKTIYPAFLGATVVCQGADDATVRLSIISAVASLTGLGSDKITVVKMK